ncbi:DUF4123 domain-containing protein [Pseudoduganella albidiflava]|uniref:DUF4123 domain-containing protein n=1 Tax=Pseudoduganella albidiflava TaxID=321983 RepID=A0A411X1B7_9BURK|nr:DUF4123 domain-containing protein [Pseudoduganella albidiflava]QBI02728.1 DUF4123 domain-containing protein [Pseudoduganella albidiflava]GGY70947.1 hypothetical protein GCM10007387_60860 [Pseudoduganella albidiflava]
MLNQDQGPIQRYALIDCAVHDHAFRELTSRFASVRWYSLFEDTPEEDLLSASPILIEVPTDDTRSALHEWLLPYERRTPSVTWIDSHLSLPVLGSMLTSRMPCVINDDDLVVLRFWDPRILLGLPSALDAEQRRHFFAPVREWTAWEPRRRQYYTITAPPDAAPVSRYVAMPMPLTDAQREQLMYYDKEVLYDRIVQHWVETCPESLDGMEHAMVREIAIAAVARCASYGIHTADDQVLFAGLMMSVSPSFDDHPAIRRGLRDESVPPDERLDRLVDDLPDAVWDQIARDKRYDALFEHQPSALA